MPTPLTKREQSLARAYTRAVKASERASAIYARAGKQEFSLAKKIFGLKNARVLDPHTRAVRLTEDGRYLVVTDQYAKAATDAKDEGEAKVWAHAAARQFKLSEKNLD